LLLCAPTPPPARSFILWATTRFEQGREENPSRFAGFVTNFRAMAQSPGSAVFANSLYDAHYVHYFTGASPHTGGMRARRVGLRSLSHHPPLPSLPPCPGAGIMPQYVPSLCLYPNVQYRYASDPPPPGRTNVILVHGYRPSPARHMSHVPVHEFLRPLQDQVRACLGRSGGECATACGCMRRLARRVLRTSSRSCVRTLATGGTATTSWRRTSPPSCTCRTR
jgi:hypothetical protein